MTILKDRTSATRIQQRFVPVIAGLLLLLPVLTACGEAQTQRPPLKVVATIAPLADWARRVGQERVTVTQIVPASVNPQTYTLTADNRRAMAEADVLLSNGRGLEPWLASAIPSVELRRMVTLDLSQYLDASNARGRVVTVPQFDPDDPSGDKTQGRDEIYIPPTIYSPYVWLDPSPGMAQRAVALISDTFMRVEPDNLLFFRRNAEQYNGELENLDNWITRELRMWPRIRAGGRDVLAMQSVDRSWHYFAVRYNINLRTLSSESPYQAPIPGPLPLFVNQFLSQSQQLELLGLRQPDGVLNPLGNDDYIELMRANVETMVKGARRVLATQNRAPTLDGIGN